ncbi:hypothetical protein L1U13_001422 [Enterococcus faecalis]|nr:hypothetical protein [Enterococcus faecalis]
MNYEWWQLWIPFFGTLITAFITIWSNRNQYNRSEKFKEELTSKQNDFERSMVQQERENSRRTELRDNVSTYMILLSNHSKELEKFVDIQRKFESMNEFNRQILSQNGGYHGIMTSDPRQELPKLNKQKDEHFDKLKSLEKDINELSQKLLLYFTDNEDNKEITEPIKFAPERISNIWGKIDSNINLEMMSVFLDLSDTKDNREKIEVFMRRYLNVEN